MPKPHLSRYVAHSSVDGVSRMGRNYWLPNLPCQANTLWCCACLPKKQTTWDVVWHALVADQFWIMVIISFHTPKPTQGSEGLDLATLFNMSDNHFWHAARTIKTGFVNVLQESSLSLWGFPTSAFHHAWTIGSKWQQCICWSKIWMWHAEWLLRLVLG